MKLPTLLIAASLLAGLLLAGAAAAQEDPEVALARSAHELSRELMSPYCPGRTLADCPSPDAGAVREEIRVALRGGEPVDSIRQRIEARFGAAVVGVPTTALGWLIPIVLLAAGAGRAGARPAPRAPASGASSAGFQRPRRATSAGAARRRAVIGPIASTQARAHPSGSPRSSRADL